MRRLVKLVINLLVLVVVLVIADRGADLYAEHQAAKALTRTFDASPDVDVKGFPFLTQWGKGQFGEATVTADQATVGGYSVYDLDLSVRDLETAKYAQNEQDILKSKAGSVRLSGTVPYKKLPMPAGISASRDGTDGNLLKLTGTASALGYSTHYTAAASIQLVNGKAKLTPKRVSVQNPLASIALTGIIRDRLNVSFSLPKLPAGLKWSAIKPADDGLRLTATGKDVTIPRK